MPKFYFHLLSPHSVTVDEIGRKLDSVEEAYLDACDEILVMSKVIKRAGLDIKGYSVEITLESGQVMMEVPFTEMVDEDGHMHWNFNIVENPHSYSFSLDLARIFVYDAWMCSKSDQAISVKKYVNIFRSESFESGHWTDVVERDGYFTPPYFVLSPDAEAFVKDCYTVGLVGGNWAAFSQTEEGRRLRTDPEAMANASEEQISLVLTTIIRADRFSPGTLADAFKTGLIIRLLERLEQLKGQVA